MSATFLAMLDASPYAKERNNNTQDDDLFPKSPKRSSARPPNDDVVSREQHQEQNGGEQPKEEEEDLYTATNKSTAGSSTCSRFQQSEQPAKTTPRHEREQEQDDEDDDFVVASKRSKEVRYFSEHCDDNNDNDKNADDGATTAYPSSSMTTSNTEKEDEKRNKLKGRNDTTKHQKRSSQYAAYPEPPLPPHSVNIETVDQILQKCQNRSPSAGGSRSKATVLGVRSLSRDRGSAGGYRADVDDCHVSPLRPAVSSSLERAQVVRIEKRDTTEEFVLDYYRRANESQAGAARGGRGRAILLSSKTGKAMSKGDDDDDDGEFYATGFKEPAITSPLQPSLWKGTRAHSGGANNSNNDDEDEESDKIVEEPADTQWRMREDKLQGVSTYQAAFGNNFLATQDLFAQTNHSLRRAHEHDDVVVGAIVHPSPPGARLLSRKPASAAANTTSGSGGGGGAGNYKPSPRRPPCLTSTVPSHYYTSATLMDDSGEFSSGGAGRLRSDGLVSPRRNTNEAVPSSSSQPIRLKDQEFDYRPYQQQQQQPNTSSSRDISTDALARHTFAQQRTQLFAETAVAESNELWSQPRPAARRSTSPSPMNDAQQHQQQQRLSSSPPRRRAPPYATIEDEDLAREDEILRQWVESNACMDFLEPEKEEGKGQE